MMAKSAEKNTTKIYSYKNCSTCVKALKYLDTKKVNYEVLPIVDQPPTVPELKKMLTLLKAEGGSLKNLFNTSGQVYRELGVAERLKGGMSEDEALQLLSKNGKLIKRPFVLTTQSGEKQGLVGFKTEAWDEIF